ncbi:hypothetical protein AAG906_019029 [Vitis piasezkii]
MFYYKRGSIPMSTSSSLSLYNGEPLSNPSLYHNIVGLYKIVPSTNDIVFPSTRYANSCTLRPQLIGKSLRGFFTILRVISQSSIEFEYRGLANEASELIWIETFLTKLHISFFTPPFFFCDNLIATHLATHPILHACTKHIEIDYHVIHDCVLHKSLLVEFTPSEEQLANILTKPLPTPCFQSLRNKLTVLHNPFNLRGEC